MKMRDKYFKGYVKEERLSGKSGRYKVSYIYHGNYFYWKVGREAAERHKRLFGILTAGGLAAMLAISLLRSQASRSAIVMAPVLLALIPLIYQVTGVVQFIRTKDKVREFDFDEINLKLRYASLVNGALMTAASVLALVWMFFSEEKQGFILLSALELGAAVCALVIHFRHRAFGAVLTEEGDYNEIKDAYGRKFDGSETDGEEY